MTKYVDTPQYQLWYGLAKGTEKSAWIIHANNIEDAYDWFIDAMERCHPRMPVEAYATFYIIPYDREYIYLSDYFLGWKEETKFSASRRLGIERT